MRSLKSLLGSSLLKGDTTVLGSAVPFKQILGLFLGELKKRAEAAAGRPFEQVVLGRPVFFVDDDPDADREAADTCGRWPPGWASRTFPSSTSRLPPPSTTKPPWRARSWC